MFDPAAIVAYFEQNPLHIVLLCFLLYRWVRSCVPRQLFADTAPPPAAQALLAVRRRRFARGQGVRREVSGGEQGQGGCGHAALRAPVQGPPRGRRRWPSAARHPVPVPLRGPLRQGLAVGGEVRLQLRPRRPNCICPEPGHRRLDRGDAAHGRRCAPARFSLGLLLTARALWLQATSGRCTSRPTSRMATTAALPECSSSPWRSSRSKARPSRNKRRTTEPPKQKKKRTS